MNETTFMIITKSIIRHNEMIPDRSQLNKYTHLRGEFQAFHF